MENKIKALQEEVEVYKKENARLRELYGNFDLIIKQFENKILSLRKMSFIAKIKFLFSNII